MTMDVRENLSVRLYNHMIDVEAGSRNEAVQEQLVGFMVAYAESITAAETLIQSGLSPRVSPHPQAPGDWADATPIDLTEMRNHELVQLFPENAYDLVALILEDYLRGALALANLKALVRRVEPRHPSILEGYLRLAGENIDADALMQAETVSWPPRNPFKRIAEDEELRPKVLARKSGVSRSTIDRVLRGEPRKAASSVIAAMSRSSGIDADLLAMEYMLWKGKLRLVCLGSLPQADRARRIYSGISIRDLDVDVLMDLAEILIQVPPLRQCENPECRKLFIARRPSVDRFCHSTCRARWNYLSDCGSIP